MTRSCLFPVRLLLPTAVFFAAILVPTAASAEAPQILWSWSFVPPGSVNDNLATVLGASDLDNDGYPDALVACEDYRVRALSGHSVGTPAVIWTYGGTDEMPEDDRSLALFPDRDGDGKPEIVYCTGGNDRSVHLLRGSNGTELWGYDLRSTGCTALSWIYEAQPVGDLNGDKVPDIAAASGSSCNRVIALSGADGSLLWQYTGADGFRTIEAAGDLSGDKVPDVLAGSGTNNIDSRAFLLSGKPSAPSRVIWDHVAGRQVASLTTVQDFTGDGTDEAIAGSWDTTVFALNGAGRGTIPAPLWETGMGAGSGAWVAHSLRIPDLDGDCIDDVAVASWTNATRIVSGRTGAVLWSAPVGTGSYASTAAIVPDLTGDLQWDYVVGSSVPGFVALFSGADGAKLWEWAAPKNVRTVASIGDIDDDGLPDILAGLQDSSTAYAFSGRTVSCVRPAKEVTGLLVTKLDPSRVRLDWSPSSDPCHGSYRILGVPAEREGRERVLRAAGGPHGRWTRTAMARTSPGRARARISGTS